MKTSGDLSTSLPPIRVVLVRGEEDVTIKIADRGGGVQRSEIKNIYSFVHTTVDSEARKKNL